MDSEIAVTSDDRIDLIALDEALERFAADHADKAKLVELRFFAGLTMHRCAEALGVSLATAVLTQAEDGFDFTFTLDIT